MKHIGQAAPDFNIDDLAATTGVPTRTIREYQRLRLLPPPTRVGRVGRYGPEHRARLSIIARLQERGYSLAAIGDLMGSWEQGRGLGTVLGVDANRAVLDEAPTELSNVELEGLVPALRDPALVEQAVASGVLHRRDGKNLARSVALLEFVAIANDSGIPVGDAIEMAEGISAGAASMAAAIVEPFVEHVWPRRSDLDVETLLKQARLLVAQAAASLVVHQLGVALGHEAALDQSGELATVIDAVAIGRIRRFA